jgi:hypothetical protein
MVYRNKSLEEIEGLRRLVRTAVMLTIHLAIRTVSSREVTVKSLNNESKTMSLSTNVPISSFLHQIIAWAVLSSRRRGSVLRRFVVSLAALKRSWFKNKKQQNGTVISMLDEAQMVKDVDLGDGGSAKFFGFCSFFQPAEENQTHAQFAT